MKNKLIHIVGGGVNQVSLVKKAKELGLRVLVTDMYEDAPCRDFADHFERANTTDRELTLLFAKKYKVDAVTTDQTDVAVPTVAYIADALNLPGIGLEAAIGFTDKRVMRDKCSQVIPENIPKYYFCENLEVALSQASKFAFPYVVKPINSQGSKGVFICREFDESKIKLAYDESRNSGILIEEFISGYEVAIESVTVNGLTRTLAFSKKDHYKENDCIDKRVNFLDELDGHLKKLLEEINAKIIKFLGLKNGITHAEYKIRDGIPVLMEIAARGAGGGISSIIIPRITGFDPSRFILANALGEVFDFNEGISQNRYAILEFFDFPRGVVKSVMLDEKIISKACFFTIKVDVGSTILPISDSRDRLGYFIADGDTKEGVMELTKMIREAVRIAYV